MFRKYKLSLLTLFILMIITSCTNISLSPEPTYSPEKLYAVEMSKILIMIENHKNGAEKNWNLLMAKPIGQMAYMFMIEEKEYNYGGLLRYILLTIDTPSFFEFFLSQEENLDEFNTLADASQTIIESVFDIQVALGGIEVPISMTVPHREIESCIESISSYHSLLFKIFNGSVPTEKEFSDLQENNCDKFEFSLRKIQQYIDEQSEN